MELKAIDRTDRARGRLDAALSIYREDILPEAQNPERQILYWIEHSKDELSDEFKCYAIQSEDKIIGYFQYSYFSEEHIFFFEYLCIRDRNRKGLTHSAAMKSIADFLAQNYRSGFTIVFEVAQKRDGSGAWQSDKKLIRAFRHLGFRTIEFDYRYPSLQSYEGEFSYPADLMVRLPNSRTEITASELRTVLRCIYFKHYLRWDRPFLEPGRFSEREQLINQLYSKQVFQIGGNDKFGTHGDDKRYRIDWFKNSQPSIGVLAERVFGPNLLKLLVLMAALLGTHHFLGTGFMLVPFVLCAALLYCLLDATEESRKLFLAILNRLKISKLRMLLGLLNSLVMAPIGAAFPTSNFF